MAETSVVNGNLTVRGVLRPDAFVMPTATVGNSEINPADPIGVDKQVHQYNNCLGDPRATSIATTTGRFIYRARGAGTIREFSVGVIVAGVTWAGGGEAEVDLLKNGSTALSSTITIDGATAALESGQQSAGLAGGGAYTANDVFEVAVTVTAGTGTVPKGLYCSLVVSEDES